MSTEVNTDWQPPEIVPADPDNPRIRAALAELQDLIRRRYPDATFMVTARRDDPAGVFLTAIVDVDDLDEVADLVVSRTVDLLVEEGLPIYVLAEWPPERIRAELRRRAVEPVTVRLPATWP